MQLTKIKQIQGKLVLRSGLRIGAGDSEMRIGGTDNPVVRNPLDGQPYIPGSSIKGKVRSLLEWQLGLVTAADGKPFSFQHLEPLDKHAPGSRGQADDARNLLRLFGGAPGGEVEQHVREIGPTRCAFWDCLLDAEWLARVQQRNVLPVEVKSENAINRITGVAENPRFTERVIAGAEFDFRLSLKVIDGEDLLALLLRGLRLLQADSLGGSGSRGYGKLELRDLTLDGEPLQSRFDAIDPFAAGN